MRYEHVLTIGTTGMLAGATYELALKTNRLTCIARTTASLKRIEGGLDRHGPSYFPIQVDYAHSDLFMAQIQGAWGQRPFDLVVAWFHSSGEESLQQLLEFLSRQQRETDLYHVVGSGAADPERPLEMFKPRPDSKLRYHRVILGFELEANGRSRWLNHGEISRGTLAAVKSGETQTIIGTIEPWHARP